MVFGISHPGKVDTQRGSPSLVSQYIEGGKRRVCESWDGVIRVPSTRSAIYNPCLPTFTLQLTTLKLSTVFTIHRMYQQ